jgi:hypothetical protein
MRAMRHAALLPLLLSSACLGAAGPPPGHTTPFVPGIRIIRPDQAGQIGVAGRPYELRFGEDQDGTKLVLDFLDEAKRAGATFVSDIRIELLTTRGGEHVRCETRLLPYTKKEKYVVEQHNPGRIETRSVPKMVTQTVTEQSYQCRMVSQPVTRMETSYQVQYDYTSKSSRSVPVTRMVTTYQSRNECTYVPVTRTVTRYEHQVETRFIPPSVTYLQAHFTDFDLVESVPRCSPVDAGAETQRQPHRIAGTIYVAGRP